MDKYHHGQIIAHKHDHSFTNRTQRNLIIAIKLL